MIDRRNLIIGGLAVSTVALGSVEAPAATPAIGAIRVEVDQLAAKGQRANAAMIKAGLERELADLRAGARGAGARLEVDVTGLYLTSYSGGSAAFHGNDSLESEARLISPGNRLIARYPIRATLPPSSGGAWYRPGGEQRRIEALIASNAQWIRRYVAG
jgi:hypothetical protein